MTYTTSASAMECAKPTPPSRLAHTRAAAADPDPSHDRNAARDDAGERTLHQRDQRQRHRPRVDEATIADLNARHHQEHRQRAEDDAVDDWPPARASGRLRGIEPAPRVRVEDEDQSDRARDLDDVVVVHGG